MLQGWGFTCSCLLCVEAKKVEKMIKEKRKALRADLMKAFEKHSSDNKMLDMGKIESILAQLEKTTGKHGEGKAQETGLWEPYLSLTRGYAMLGRAEKVVWGTLKTLEMLGFEMAFGGASRDSTIAVTKWGLMNDFVVECWMLLWTTFALMSALKAADMAKDLATSYKIIVGEDETFEETYGIRGKSWITKRVIWNCL